VWYLTQTNSHKFKGLLTLAVSEVLVPPIDVGLALVLDQHVSADIFGFDETQPNRVTLTNGRWFEVNGVEIDSSTYYDLVKNHLTTSVRSDLIRAVDEWRTSATSNGWQPIATAPKDQRVLLYVPFPTQPIVVCGRWEPDKYSARPRPYWTNDQERLYGRRDTRQYQPSHWRQLPGKP
jgi:hypothetical protein